MEKKRSAFYRALKSTIYPVALLFIVILLRGLSFYGLIPNPSTVLINLVQVVKDYGLIVVGPISFIENMAGLNVYFPGSIVILAAMAATAGEPYKAVLMFLLITLFAFFAYNINFILARRMLGIRKKELQTSRMAKKKLWLRFLFTFWHPHLASITCVQVASEGFQYREIFKIMVFTSLFWNSFWALTMYVLGGYIVKSSVNLDWMVYAYLLGWMILNVLKEFGVMSKIKTIFPSLRTFSIP